jgi:hypothetical protein
VILAVDITKKKGVIKKEFGEVLKRIEKDCDIPKDTSKDNKDTQEDIWEIYDYKTKDKLSLYKIAQRRSGIKDKFDYYASSEKDKYSKRVRTAYRKAEEIMDVVKKDVEEAIRANEERKEADRKTKQLLKRMTEDSKKERTLTIADRLLGRTPKK